MVPCLACSLAVTVAAVAAVGVAPSAPSAPLCHGSFRALEECLGHDHQRLHSQCAKPYASLRSCLDSEWVTLDAAGAYKKPPNAFNRLKPCRHGLMLYNPMDWYIGRSLEVYGEWAEKKLQLWARFLQPGHVAIDVGAHVGTLTLPLAKLVGPSGRVVAIEAFYPSFAALAANTGLNSLENVEVIRAVVAQKSGKMRMDRGILAFKQHDFFNYGSMDFHDLDILPSTEPSPSSSQWDEYTVMNLDALSPWRLDLLKIDAQVMEKKVLQGASGLIRKFKPLIFVEYRNPKQTKSRLLQWMKKMHYECVLVRLPIFNDKNFRMHQEDIWSSGDWAGGSIVNFNLFCRSSQQDYPHLGDVAVLFSSAVDTDVAGLRSTPLPDPFEVMAKYGKSDSVKRKDVRTQKKKVQRPKVEEMSMEELLDLVDPAGAEAAARDSMTLEELVEAVNKTEEQSAAVFPAETTLDEL